MQTTTATYNIRIEYRDGTVEDFNRTMPTKPTTHKGIRAQNDRLVNWVDKYVGRRDCIRHTVTPLFSWIMLKQNVLKVVGQTANSIDPKMTRADKFDVFCRVCDNLLEDGRISRIQHERWTNVF